jgi:multiple sugar transport system permease protein
MQVASLEMRSQRAAAVRPRRRFDFFPYLLVGPILLLLLAISFYPALDAVWLAMTDATLLRLARAKFIGAQNFLRLWEDPIFLNGLWRTLRWDVAVVAIELAIALPIALFLNLKFRGRGILRAVVVIPYIIPPAVTALMWV